MRKQNVVPITSRAAGGEREIGLKAEGVIALAATGSQAVVDQANARLTKFRAQIHLETGRARLVQFLTDGQSSTVMIGNVTDVLRFGHALTRQEDA